MDEVAERNRARKRMRDSGEPQVGIFLFVEEPGAGPLILGFPEFLAFAKKDGPYLTGDETYENFWSSMRQMMSPGWRLAFLADSDYREWPRGRVVFHTDRKRFEVHLEDRLQEQRFKDEISSFFGLPKDQTVFLTNTDV